MIFWLIFLFFFLPQKTGAVSDNFSTQSQIRFSINDVGDAIVRHQYQIANNYSEIYPKEYNLKLPYPNLFDVSADDNYGNILKNITHDQDYTQIFLEFNRPEIGKGKTTKFTLNYRQPSLARQKGNTREIEIPKTDAQIELDLPLSFGDLSFSSVAGSQISVSGNRQNLKLGPGSPSANILLIFGNYQLFDFKLSYNLKNDHHQTAKTEIAIPPDTTNQQIIFNEINPKPINITTDIDGNWLALYHLPPQSELEILVSGQAKVLPQKNLPVQIDKNIYTREQQFWPVTSPQISSYQFDHPKKIYDFVVSHLNYNYDLISQAERKGADFALENPQNALCTEFTDLFVTLARANGIPAREIQGFAYTNNPKIKPINLSGSILHAWPQYYHFQKQTWISVDPTWEKTTHGIDYFNDLDLNHLTMVIHGQSSTSPQIANKSVIVDFAKTPLPKTNTPPKISFSGHSNLVITNPNNHALTNLNLSVKNNWQQIVDLIPPYGQYSLIAPKILFKNKLNFELSSDLQNYPSVSFPNYYYFTYLALSAILILLGGIILAIIKRKK